MAEPPEEYNDLWTTDVEKYVLISEHPERGSTEDCSIFDRVGRMACIIEDEDVSQAVMKRMVEAGVPIVGPEILRDKPAK